MKLEEPKGTKNNLYGRKQFELKWRCKETKEDSCEKCDRLVQFGELQYCGFRGTHNQLAEVIKGARIDSEGKEHGCIFCKHIRKRISTNKCSECLATVDLVNFQHI